MAALFTGPLGLALDAAYKTAWHLNHEFPGAFKDFFADCADCACNILYELGPLPE